MLWKDDRRRLPDTLYHPKPDRQCLAIAWVVHLIAKVRMVADLLSHSVSNVRKRDI